MAESSQLPGNALTCPGSAAPGDVSAPGSLNSFVLCMELNFTFCEHRMSWPRCILTSTLYSIGFPKPHGHLPPLHSQGDRAEVRNDIAESSSIRQEERDLFRLES